MIGKGFIIAAKCVKEKFYRKNRLFILLVLRVRKAIIISPSLHYKNTSAPPMDIFPPVQ